MVAVATATVEQDANEAPSRWPQFLAAALATLCAASNGSVLGWSSPSLPVLQHQQLMVVRDDATVNVTTLPAIVTEDEASWVGSLVPLGALLGSVPAGFVADALGRKPVMMGIGLHFFVGWMLIIASTMRRGVWLLFTGRALQGACCGAITVVLPLYLEEIAEAQIRGCTGVLFDLATNAGVFGAYVLGALLAPPALAGALSALPALFLIAFAFMPESPVHLAAKGHEAAARRALSWLRPGRDVTEELADMMELLRSSGRLRAQTGAAPEVAMDPAHLETGLGKAGKAGAGALPSKRVSLPALLSMPPVTVGLAVCAPGRRYSINLCAAQNDVFMRKDQNPLGHDNVAFDDTETSGRLSTATEVSQAAIVTSESGPQRHRPLATRTSAQPILASDGEGEGEGAGAGRSGRAQRLREWARDLRWGSPSSRSLGIVFCLMVIRPATGINAITFYTVSIFREASTSLSPSMATVIIGALLVPCNLLASRLVDRVGRRVLLLASSVGISVCYTLLVAYSCTEAEGAPRWVPVAAVAIFTVSFCVGLGPLPWLLMSELLPLRHRRWAAGTAGAISWAGGFAVTKFFTSALHAFGPVALYSAFLACVVAGGIFIALCVPETRGKTRQQLQT